MQNLKPCTVSVLFFALACERIFFETRGIESGCYRTGNHTVCRRVRASFSPDILQAGAVKGLNKIHFIHSWRQGLHWKWNRGWGWGDEGRRGLNFKPKFMRMIDSHGWVTLHARCCARSEVSRESKLCADCTKVLWKRLETECPVSIHVKTVHILTLKTYCSPFRDYRYTRITQRAYKEGVCVWLG